MSKYVGSHALVTGASSEVGQKICRKLMKAGVKHLVICLKGDRGDLDLKTMTKAEQLRKQNAMQSVHFKEGFDFSTPDSIETKFAEIIKNNCEGKLHHMFLCHAKPAIHNISNCDLPDFDESLLLNVRSNVHMMSLAFPFLKQNANDNNRTRSSITILTTPECNMPDPRNSV